MKYSVGLEVRQHEYVGTLQAATPKAAAKEAASQADTDQDVLFVYVEDEEAQGEDWIFRVQPNGDLVEVRPEETASDGPERVNADLLEALRGAEVALTGYSGGVAADLEPIREAIAKAEGAS